MSANSAYIYIYVFRNVHVYMVYISFGGVQSCTLHMLHIGLFKEFFGEMFSPHESYAGRH